MATFMELAQGNISRAEAELERSGKAGRLEAQAVHATRASAMAGIANYCLLREVLGSLTVICQQLQAASLHAIPSPGFPKLD